MLASFVFNLGSFSYTSRAGFIFIQGVSLTHPVLALVLSGKFLLHIPCLLFFLWGVSLTHPMMTLFLSGELFFTHPVLALFFCRKFLLHIPCWLHFYLGSFSYISHAGFFFLFLSGEFLLHIPCRFLFLSGEFLLHTPCWLLFFMWGTSLVCSFLWRTEWKMATENKGVEINTLPQGSPKKC